MISLTQSRRRTRSWRSSSIAVATAAATALLVVSSACGTVSAFSSLRPASRQMHRTGGRTGGSPLAAVETRPKQKQQGIPPGSPLDMICKDQHEFELAVGHAMDTLRNDYPCILTEKPDFTIYDSELEVVDPSGVTLYGVKNYRTFFRLLHTMVGFFYCPERSGLTFRMCFDKARQNIRIQWNARVIPKAIFGGERTTLYIDGISVYEISRNSGNITQHRIERLVINDSSITPENGIFSALRKYAAKSNVGGVPVFSSPHSSVEQSSKDNNNPTVLRFQNFLPHSRSLLFSGAISDDTPQQQQQQQMTTTTTALTAMESSTAAFDGNIDWDALEKKNMARKKFGLKPLTPEEFKDLQEQVAELDSQQQKRAAAAASRMAEEKARQVEDNGFFKKLFGNALENTCESNFDCQRPEVCCDLGIKKICCSSGAFVVDGPPRSRQGQLAEIPVIASPGPNFPRDPRLGGNRY